MVKVLARFAGGLVVGTALALTAAGPVLASSSGGAASTGDHCFSLGGPFSACFHGHETFNQVSTPSGNHIFTDNYKGVLTFYLDGTAIETDRTSGHSHVLYKSATDYLQEQHYAFSDTYTQDGVSCTASLHYHFAHGRIQFERPSGDCE
ncbi:hypothetical protein QDR37_10105 [Amnibacterium sp. CER49]|uniref:hypothetical protein n=1 Tax=Amnibacterium sp. CER49 TaxID=3039161 RepID=UPI0024497238|nr:hypothetical protein [Amnibacterium sp. CER49]MDH2444293.1 hypothetical protein [Amnibacterium sp. CER49]